MNSTLDVLNLGQQVQLQSPSLVRRLRPAISVGIADPMPSPPRELRRTSKRSISLPVINDTSIKCPEKTYRKEDRRKIFGTFWNKSDDDAESSTTSSNNTATDSSHHAQHQVDIRAFSPQDEQRVALKPYHASPEEFILTNLASLPSIPAPLQRYNSNHGCFPLNSPSSILRSRTTLKRWKSAGDQNRTEAQSEQDVEHPHKEETKQDESESERMHEQELKLLNLQMTKSTRNLSGSSLSKHGRILDETEEVEEEDDIDTTKLPGQNPETSGKDRRVIHFDPRIVVTEFADYGNRPWYSEAELDRFKAETIMVAQKYMLLHPEDAVKFSEQKQDPITGQRRKRALFSLPILSAIPDEFDLEKENQRIEKLVKVVIRKILVVDPNKAILDLFRRGFLQMFPHANVVTVQTGEEALRSYTVELAKRGHAKKTESYDIILVEERLFRPRQRGSGTYGNQFQGMGQAASASKLQALSSFSSQEPMPKQTSFSHLDIFSFPRPVLVQRRRGMSGSQLISKVRQLEDQAFGIFEGKSSKEDESSHRALLIGVSVNLERDGIALQNSGADVVWSKPPPSMGKSLRNQLLGAVLAKREMTMQLPQEKQPSSAQSS